jgi:hypothetical protein
VWSGCAELTVTGNNEELIVLVDVMDFDVGERSHYLLLRRKIGALLELEVANGTRQGEVAVDAAKIDEATCSLDTGLLGCEMLVESRSVGG